MHVIHGCATNNIKMGQEMEPSEPFSTINRTPSIGLVPLCLLSLLSLHSVCPHNCPLVLSILKGYTNECPLSLVLNVFPGMKQYGQPWKPLNWTIFWNRHLAGASDTPFSRIPRILKPFTNSPDIKFKHSFQHNTLCSEWQLSYFIITWVSPYTLSIQSIIT